MDSPALRLPTDPAEQPILDKLLIIRDNLLLLKSDRSQYVKAQDVEEQYELLLEEVEALNKIRTSKREEQNRVDRVLDDCLSLVSLFFLTIGRNNEAPAAYSLVATIKRLLDHLKEAGFFARQDLVGLSHRLNKMDEAIERGHGQHSPHILTLLASRVASCRTTLAQLEPLIAQLTPDLESYHTKLVSILRSLSSFNTKARFDTRGVKGFQGQLDELKTSFESKYGRSAQIEHKDLGPTEAISRYVEKISEIMNWEKTISMTGEGVVRDLIERTYLWSDIVLERHGRIDESFKDTFDELLSIRNMLEKLQLTQVWSLRETDLYGYQRKLDRIDESRVNGQFISSQNKKADVYEHRTMLYLIRKSYALIYYMMTSSEPVSEALLPIYNQLSTLKKCLVEVQKSGGVSSARELYPYSMKLASIDNMRKDGKFVVNGDVPDGQGSINELLSECYDLAYDLRAEAEQEEDDDDDRVDETPGDEHTEKNLAESVRNGISNMNVSVSS